MHEPVVSREDIARIADPAARDFVRTGVKPKNPYPEGGAAHAAYEATFSRFVLMHSAGIDCESGA